MPVEKDAHGNLTITGTAIEVASWLALKHALKLQLLGINRSSGRASAIAKRRLGIPQSKRPKIDTLIAAVEAKIEQLEQEGKHLT